MMENQSHILVQQQSAGVVKMILGSMLTMLPVLTFGTLSAFLTVGLPQLLEPNGTGIMIDIYQLSWVCKYHDDQ